MALQCSVVEGELVEVEANSAWNFPGVAIVAFSFSVVSNSLQPHGLQHIRLPVLHCLPEFAHIHVHWVTDATQPSISSSVSPFSSCLQSFQAWGSFPMSQFFASGDQSIRASAWASILPMNIQDSFPLGLTGFDLLSVQGTLKSLPQHHSSKASILWCSAFFMARMFLPYVTTGKTIALTVQTFVQNDVSSAF